MLKSHDRPLYSGLNDTGTDTIDGLPTPRPGEERPVEADEVDVAEARGLDPAQERERGGERAFYYFTCRNVYRDVWPLRFILLFPPPTRRLRASSQRAFVL